jgi:hypothetical protein
VKVDFAARQGTYAPWWKTVEVVIYDWPSGHADAKLSNSAGPLKMSYDAHSHALRIVIPDSPGESELQVSQQ